MHVQQFVISPLQSNCYVLSDSLEAGAAAIIVDPGDPGLDEVFGYIDEHRFKVEAVWCTHAHFDHVLGVDVARQRYQVPAYVHEADTNLWDHVHAVGEQWLGQSYTALQRPDVFWKDGTELTLGPTTFTIWHTPGHSPGGVCIVSDELVFTGDTLFAGTIGRTDFPESNPQDMTASLRRLLHLPQSARLYPGHMHETTMAVEMQSNPFLQQL